MQKVGRDQVIAYHKLKLMERSGGKGKVYMHLTSPKIEIVFVVAPFS